jgi:hypothetical protein
MKLFGLILILCLGYFNADAFSDSTVSSKELKHLAGCWQGSLTYLDYSTGKPFTMPADIVVRDFGNSNSIIVSFLYPKEPKANGNDTLRISPDGRTFNGKPVKSKQWIDKDSLEIITEIAGRDGNDNKPVVIRHTYILSDKTFLQKKEVKFTGETKWILRNEYKFMRKEHCE